MQAFRILSFVTFLAMPLIAMAQFETNWQRINRENNAQQWATVHAEQRRQIDKFNVEIADARAKFWATYPDKPGAKEATKRFFDLLYDKDEFYVTSALSNRMSTGGDPGDSLDDGIRSTAQPEFDDFIAAARPGIAMQSGDMAKMVQTVWAAIDSHPTEFRRYRLERDFWEFDQVHRIPANWDSPEKYPIYLYIRYLHLPVATATTSTAQLIELFGKDVVTSAARKVMDAPKTDKGNMVVTAPRAIKYGPGGSQLDDYSVPEPANPIGGYPSPLSVFIRLISQNDDRSYLLRLLSNEHLIDSTTIDRVNQWPLSGRDYTRLVAAFGEKDVLETARQVRTATKRRTDGMVMDPKALGVQREAPFSVFEDILARKNPRGYVRSALAFSQSLDSKAAIDAAYQALVANGQEEAYLTAARRHAKDRPNVISSFEIRSIKALLNAPPEVEKPPEEMVDAPLYLDWKRFSPGTRVTYHERKWMASRPRPGSYNSADPTHLLAYPPDAIVSYQLKSIDDQKASLWLTQSAAGVYGNMHPASDSEIVYLAKYPKSVADRNAKLHPAANNGPTPTSNMMWNAKRTDDPVESGEEIVEVKGHRIATRWESAKYRGEDFNNEVGITIVVTVWTSDAIPTGQVRRTEDKRVQHIPGQMQPARYIIETYLESFDGFTPPAATGSGPVMTAYTPPPLSGDAAAAQPPPSANNRTGGVSDPALQRTSPSANQTAPAKALPVPAQPKPHAAPTPAAPPIDTSRMPPEVARQVELSQKYNAAAARASRARSQLLQWPQTHGASAGSIPAEVLAARDSIPGQLQATMRAMGSRDPGQSEKALATLNASAAVIEEFLAR